MLKKTIKMVAKTFFGLEEVLRKEVEEIGGKNIKVLNRAIEFEGDLALMYSANLKLRTALSIITPIHEFKATTPEELYERAVGLDWGRYFNLHQTFSVHAVVHSQYFNHSQYVALKVKDAIADHFRNKYNERPNVDKKDADIGIVLYVNSDSITVLLDTSGKALFQRGYKTQLTQAPMNEVLAAGIILLSGWNKMDPFIDPMCGSGTLLVEAAMIASNYPPNMLRKRFGFQNFKNYDAQLWKQIVDQATSQIKRELPPIYGNDICPDVIQIATENIQNAGFNKQIKLTVGDFRDYIPAHPSGVLITNPPYDERLKSDDINGLYSDLGTSFKNNYVGFHCWVFSGNLNALKKVALKPSQKIKLYNGSIEGSLNGFEMYEGSKKLVHE